ncbi:TPA: DUF4376 domain-containing protein [Enterobacter kobei]
MTEFTFSDEPQILPVHNYHPATKEYIGPSDCYVSPNTGLPAGCVLVGPGECPPGYAHTWTGEAWELAEDHRGEILYNIENGYPVTLSELGPLPDGLTAVAPDSQFDIWTANGWQKDVSAIKANLISAIKKHRDQLTAEYIIVDGYYFHSDANSRIQQMTLTKMGKENKIPPGLMWQTKNSGLIELTNELASKFEDVTIEHDIRLFSKALEHINAVNSIESAEEALAYDITQGWQP